MKKYAIYKARYEKKVGFRRVSDFYKTAEEAVEAMNGHFYSKTKVMELDTKTKETRIIAYHKNCY